MPTTSRRITATPQACRKGDRRAREALPAVAVGAGVHSSSSPQVATPSDLADGVTATANAFSTAQSTMRQPTQTVYFFVN
jgi:hypothetical protein